MKGFGVTGFGATGATGATGAGAANSSCAFTGFSATGCGAGFWKPGKSSGWASATAATSGCAEAAERSVWRKRATELIPWRWSSTQSVASVEPTRAASCEKTRSCGATMEQRMSSASITERCARTPPSASCRPSRSSELTSTAQTEHSSAASRRPSRSSRALNCWHSGTNSSSRA